MVAHRSTVVSLASTQWSHFNWLVIAPHADDETLGAGALIADAARRNALAGVVYLTDGTGSHAHTDLFSRTRLAATRRREALLALRTLSLRPITPVFLGWPDARPFNRKEKIFEQTRKKIAAICRERAVDAIAVTASHEPHCDHKAACDLAYAVARNAGRRIRIFEYIVWADREPGSAFYAVRTPAMLPSRRKLALMSHRSQTTPLFGEGFRLPTHQLRMATSDVIYTRRNNHAS